MWHNYKKIIEKSNVDLGDRRKTINIESYNLKKFTRKKINQAFEVYLTKTGRKHSSFKKGKVKLMKEWGIDEYTAYHITENFEGEYLLDKNNEVMNFPKRGKNIPEDILMRILGNMNIDPIWFFIEPLTAPVRFLEENALIVNKNNEENLLIIPIYEKIEQLTQKVTSEIELNQSILTFLELNFIKKNEMHPIFRYPNYAFIKLKNEYCLTNLWEQDLVLEKSFIVYNRDSLKLSKITHSSDISLNSQNFILGKILLTLENLI